MGGADYPFRHRKPVDSRLTDTDFVETLFGTVVPLLASRNAPSRQTFSDPHIECSADPLQAYRVEEFVQLLLDEDDNGCEDFAFRQAASGADPQRMAADYLGPAAPAPARRLLADGRL